MTKEECELIDRFVDFLIKENCSGCDLCEPRLSNKWNPDIVCLNQGEANFFVDVARRFKEGEK